MTVHSDSGQPIDPQHASAQFSGFFEIPVGNTDYLHAVFSVDYSDPDNPKGTTTLTWSRERTLIDPNTLQSETYTLYRYPARLLNYDDMGSNPPFINTPIANFGDYDINSDVNIRLGQSQKLVDNLPSQPTPSPTAPFVYSYDYDVPAGTMGWFFYALVISFPGVVSKIIVPQWGVWESVIGPNHAEAPFLNEPVSGYKKVSLSWTPVDGATGYRVYFADGLSVSDINAPLLRWPPPGVSNFLTTTSTTVTGLIVDPTPHTYYFRVRAISSETMQEGPFSNERAAVPVKDVAPPNRVLSVSATDLGTGGKVRVNWSYAPPADFDHYDIYYAKTSNFTSLVNATYFGKVTDISQTSVVVSGLDNDDLYGFVVVPVDEATNYFSDNLVAAYATPTNPVHVVYSDDITVHVSNVTEAVSGVASPHVFYGLLRLPVEFSDIISLQGMDVTVSVTLSAIGGTVESLKTTSDIDGFWSVNLANLTRSEWKDGDFVVVNVKDWHSSFIGEASLTVIGDAGAQRVDMLLSDSSLRSPVLVSPISGGVSEYPIFRLYSTNIDINVKFKIEVSDDNFRSILRVFDENATNIGWTRDRMIIDGAERLVAIYRSFQNDRLVNGENYQWRAYAWNGVRYSMPSAVAQFKVVSEQLDKASVIWRYRISADPIVELFALSTDTFRFVGASQANGAVITDPLPIIEWKLTNPTARNVHFRLEIDNEATFSNKNGKLRIYESKDQSQGFEFSKDGGHTWEVFGNTGADSGIQLFRYVFRNNLEVR